MKARIKQIAAAMAIILAAGSAYAQNEERQLDRQVDVSRDYVPDMERAAKLALSPDMTDTVALRPEFEYSIRPSAWFTGFGVAAINPVRVDAATYDPLYPFYLKIGGGFPSQSLVDLYVTTTGRGKGSAGAYVNHYGQYGKIGNDLGYKAGAAQSNNRLGIFGRAPAGERITLEGEIGYDYDIWSRYGQSVYPGFEGEIQELKSDKQAYSVPRGKILFGNSFSDLSYLNFRLGVSGQNLTDKEDNTESGLGAFAQIGKQFDVHRLTLKGSFDGAFGSDNRRGYYSRTFAVTPMYGIVGDGLKLEFGGDITYNTSSLRSGKTYFLPRANLTLDISNGYFVPFADLDSRMVNNGFYSLTRRNPYLDPATELHADSREHNLRAGFSGSVSSYFTYRIYAGGGIWKDPVFFYAKHLSGETQSAVAGVTTDKEMKIFTAGVELEGRVSGSFSIGLSGHYYDYSSLEAVSHAYGMPEYEGRFFARYNCLEKLFVRAAADLTGDRYFADFVFDSDGTDYTVYADKQKAAVDISLEAEYFLNRGFGIFLSGHNLANQKLYQFNHYPGRGVRIDAGIKLLF